MAIKRIRKFPNIPHLDSELDWIAKNAGNEKIEKTVVQIITEQSDLQSALNSKANTVHTHTESHITDLDKYTQSEVDSLLSGKADTGHTHDDRYYTETEVDTLLSGKANTSHTHVEADITDLGSYIEDITEESLSDLQDVTITSIASGEILKWNGTAWINNTLAEAGISATGHTHDDRYYTETETDSLLSGKADSEAGLPPGGTTNQILQKISGDDYDTEWSANPILQTLGIGTIPDPGVALHIKTETLTSLYYQLSIASNAAPSFRGRKSRGTISSPSIVNSNDFLVRLFGQGYDGSLFRDAGYIAVLVDGSPGSGNMPGRIGFYVSPSGTVTPVEAGRITNDQVWTLVRTGTTDNIISRGLQIRNNPSSAGANGLGSGILFQLKTSTTDNQSSGAIDSAWTNATHASRTADLIFSTTINGTVTEVLRLIGGSSLNVISRASGILDIIGSGDPEGAVTAPVGSMFRRTDGGAGTTLYIKESGTGNTGWQAK
jgi:hypothetical protein